ncbi:OstA-like protein [uncultured Lutibacter sp.]|uniref:OstA-like protein n=1 Tax=uncultured Lutibacter sp. TaxID=437739 RepID=UPI00260F4082|nr:OstA-like protein [uncultured Lutibacter sp.]
MKNILFIVFVLFSIVGNSQTKRIKIIHADNTFVKPEFPGATISMGNVFIEHEGATLRCDKAYIYQESNLMKAMGNVVINQGDTIFQYSKYTDYDGNTKIATSWGKVLLKDELMELRTDTLKFDRANQHLYYKSGGTIKDTTNLLTSKIGNYYLQTNKFQAFTNVDVVNKDSKLVSNHLDYYTKTGIADLFGPSTITNDNNKIYTEKGRHNSKTNISHFIKNSKIFYSDRTIQGDSLYYNKNRDFASATGNIKVIDTVNNSVIKGGYAEYFKLKDSVFIIDKAVAISEMEKDSIYIHGDTLMLTGKVEERILKAFNHVKIFKTDLQGKCDSLVSNEKTGLTKLFTNPVLWAEGNQITGDTIHLISNVKTEQLDSLKILNNGFIIKKDSAGYTQLKGKNMYGKFENNSLKSLITIGNSESIIFLRNEFQMLIGIDKKESSKNIYIELENNEFSFIDYNTSIKGKTYPPSDFEKLPPEKKLFKDFIWRENERPLTKDDIFNREDTPNKIKGEKKLNTKGKVKSKI